MIRACTLGRRQSKTLVDYDKRRNRRRNRFEIFWDKLKDLMRLATRYGGCSKILPAPIAFAATVIHWL